MTRASMKAFSIAASVDARGSEAPRSMFLIAGNPDRLASSLQRLQKTLEDANIKLDTVITDIVGVSGRAMIEAAGTNERPIFVA
jgi:hypothetical protein